MNTTSTTTARFQRSKKDKSRTGLSATCNSTNTILPGFSLADQISEHRPHTNVLLIIISLSPQLPSPAISQPFASQLGSMPLRRVPIRPYSDNRKISSISRRIYADHKRLNESNDAARQDGLSSRPAHKSRSKSRLRLDPAVADFRPAASSSSTYDPSSTTFRDRDRTYHDNLRFDRGWDRMHGK